MYQRYGMRDDRMGGHRSFDDREGFGGPFPRENSHRRPGDFAPHGSPDFTPNDAPGFDSRPDFRNHRGPHGHRRPGDFAPHGNPDYALNDNPGFDSRPDFRNHRGPHGHGFRHDFGGPGDPSFGGPGGPGFPPHGGMPPRGGMPPFGMRPPRGGMPHRRPNPEFLRRRVEDADLAELIDMAGRMQHRRPQGGPARGQELILALLAGREALSQRELQQMLAIQPGSLSELISKLEAKGYLTREKAEDRRGNLLRLTDEGRKAIPQSQDAPEDDPFAPLTAAEQDQLAAMLRRLLTYWVDGMDDPVPPSHPDQKPVQI